MRVTISACVEVDGGKAFFWPRMNGDMALRQYDDSTGSDRIEFVKYTTNFRGARSFDGFTHDILDTLNIVEDRF